VTIIKGHLNLVNMHSDKKNVIIITILVLNALTSTHLVALFLAKKMYLFIVNMLVGWISHTKSNPRFINGSFKKLVTSFAKLWVANPPILWHASQNLQYSCTFLYRIGHQYPASNIFIYVILVAKWPFDGISCNSLNTICVFIVVKHFHSLLSWSILYNSLLFSVEGSIFFTNLWFYHIDNVPSIWSILKKIFYIIQALCKTNLHLWFDQAHLWVM
jgi:hypothetical protein